MFRLLLIVQQSLNLVEKKHPQFPLSVVYFTNVTSRSDEMKQKIGYLYGYVTTGSNFGVVA